MKARLLILLLSFFVILKSHAQDSLATIYFYKTTKYDKAFIPYNLNKDNKPIGRIMSGRLVTFRCKSGLQLITATNANGKDSVALSVEDGQWYFVRCSHNEGKPVFEIVPPETARGEIGMIDSDIASQIRMHSVKRVLPLNYDPSKDSLATIYFYRTGNIAGFAVSYDVYHGINVIGRIKVSTVFTYRCKPGLQTFEATTEGTNSITLNIKAGQLYFVQCAVGAGAFIGRPTFRQIISEEARSQISIINPLVADYLPTHISESFEKSDTIRALQNLFHRKRKGGTTRAAVFGGLGLAASINASKTGGDGGTYIMVGFSLIMVVTGITQANKYSGETLAKIVEDYRRGTKLPPLLKSKFKKKDFK